MRESELLQHIYSANGALPPQVTIPPGDDMGAVRVDGGEVLVTVDQVADGVHFRLPQTPLEKVGRKAMMRNISDVAAMGALPVGAVAAVCLPRAFSQAQAAVLFDAIRDAGHATGCPLIGGDIAIWDGRLLITVTVLAQSGGVAPVLRRGALVGDVVCVTGELGGSLEPLDGKIKHLDFDPRLAVGRKLACDLRCRPHAMLDISDGLGVDLANLCRASGVRAQVRAEALPVSAAAEVVAKRSGRPAWRHALSDGEDYELCFTVAPDVPLPTEIEGVAITKVGVITAAAGNGQALVTVLTADGKVQPVEGWGWEHGA
jgi:thiamine-monophosphate kinase